MKIEASSGKQSRILEALRERIVKGTWEASSRVPPHAELAQEFGVSTFTIQQALEQLTQDGFTEVHARRGTYVVAYPPHLCRYALVHRFSPDQVPRWTRFWTALENESIRMRRPPEQEFLVFYGINGHTDTGDYKRLEQAVQKEQFAGLIFTSDPLGLEHLPLFQRSSMPRVALSSTSHPTWTSANLDLNAFIDRALDRLLEQGKRRIALVTPRIPESEYGRHVVQAVMQRGMEMRPYWFQTVDASTPQAARNCTHLLLSNPADRPEALVITDDNLVEYASAGIVASGVRAPEELTLIAHCNFPWLTPSIVPAQRLGYNARTVLETSIQLISQQRRGETPTFPAPLQPLFEEEL